MLANHQIIPMNKLIVFAVAKNTGNRLGALAFDAISLIRIVVHQTAGNFNTVAIDTADQFTPGKLALYVGHAYGQ